MRGPTSWNIAEGKSGRRKAVLFLGDIAYSRSYVENKSRDESV